MATNIQLQSFDFFLVLDFEATCTEGKKIDPQEIIEFPVLKVNAKNFKTEAVFHEYVQPKVHTQLSSFCTELTGIIQDMVDGKPHIEEVLQKFYSWMEKEGLQDEQSRSIFVTMGDWDLNVMLPHQAKAFSIEYPDYLKQWINIKKPYAEFVGQYPRDMMQMLKHLGIEHEGRHHSGIDDCKNIAKILKHLAENGVVFNRTGSLTL